MQLDMGCLSARLQLRQHEFVGLEIEPELPQAPQGETVVGLPRLSAPSPPASPRPLSGYFHEWSCSGTARMTGRDSRYGAPAAAG